MGEGDTELVLDILPLELASTAFQKLRDEVKWNHMVVGIEHGEEEAKVKVEAPEGEQTLAADYVIGADGANSQIRRSLFGDLAFPGETLQHQIIATNVGRPFIVSDISIFDPRNTNWS